jgi:hypothetical protein
MATKKMQKGGPTPYSIRMSTEPMTPKEKRQSKRNTNATIRYVKKNGSGLKMNTDKTNKGVYQDGGGKNSSFTNPYANIPMNSKPIPGSTYQPKERSKSMLKARPKMEGPMNKPMTPEGWSSENNIETPRVPMMYKKTGGMVNANAKIAASKKATGKSGGTTKAISKVAVKSASPKGRVGGTSTAPKKALPKAQMGAIVNGPKSPGGKPKAGGAILKSTSKIDPTVGGRVPKSFIGKGKPKAGGVILKGTSKAKMGGMKGKSC